MIIKFSLKRFLLSLALPLAAGGLSALITGKDMKIYNSVVRPPLSPPAVVFPIVWAILYILMGVSFYLIWNNKTTCYYDKKHAFIPYYISLFLNFIWSPIFFSFRQYLLAFAILIAMLCAVIITAVRYHRLNKWAGLLQIPYIVWLIIAGYLTLGIYILNK